MSPQPYLPFDTYLRRWALTPDGEPIITHSSQLLPVRHRDKAAMLKVATSAEECWGNFLMVWWDGDGAAPVLAHDDHALLMERAMGRISLVEMVRNGQDDEASRIICAVVAKLHAPRKKQLPDLIPLSQWFRELYPAAKKYGGTLPQASAVAEELLAEQQDIVVLHGDIHHGNVLDFQAQGFLAIDPKGLIGERSFDFANIFCNPDMETAMQPGRLMHQLKIVSEAANLDPKRLLKWILAYAGLSAAWSLEDGTSPHLALGIAKLVALAL